MFLTEAANRGSISTGYDIANSLLLDNSDSSMEYNHHQMATGGDDQWSAQSNAGTDSEKATVSLWIKRAKLSPSSGAGQYARLCQFQTGGNATALYFVDDQLAMYDDVTSANLKTTRKFRDTSAWYHVVLAMDSSQSTAANRVKIYVNGEQQTDWATEDYGNQNTDLAMFSTTNVVWYLGCAAGNGQGYTFDGYMTEFHFVDGAQKAASDFGEYDEDSGIWKPKQYTGSYGTLGCYYNFEDTSNNRFNDESGNDNYMDNRGGSFEGKITTDTPTNNFAVPNILISTGGYFVITEGATKGVLSTSGPGNNIGGVSLVSTLTPSSGKWYFEAQNTNDGDVYLYIGAADTGSIGYYDGKALGGTGSNPSVAWRGGGAWGSNSKVGINNVATGSSVTWETEVVGAALDLDNNKIYFHKSGTWINSGDPASGTDNGGQYDLPTAVEGQWVLGVSAYNLATWNVNFGGYTSMSISSAQTDANGYGTFEYAPPSGYYALCTKNLAEYG